MTRAINASLLQSIQADEAVEVWLVELEFSGGTTYLTTASGDISYGGNTYSAVGGLLTSDGIEESLDRKAEGVSLKLPGVDQALVSEILTEKTIGRSARILLAHLNETTGTITGTPLTLFEGEMNDGFSITGSRDPEEGGTVTIESRLVSKMSRFSTRRGIKMNLESHQRFFSGDKGFEYVPALANRVILWGQRQYQIGDDSGYNPTAWPPGAAGGFSGPGYRY
jgi:hypothetical protein